MTLFGEFGDAYESAEEKIFFGMVTIVGPLVLLNLLIAIITDLQDHAQSRQDISDIKEKLLFIDEIGRILCFIKRSKTGYIHFLSTKFIEFL